MTGILRAVIIVTLTILSSTFATDSHAARVQPIQDIEGAPIPDGLSMDQIADAIVKAGAQRGWMVAKDAPGQLTGTLLIRSHMAKVDIRFDTQAYSIVYKDSSNLKWEPGKIHRNYNSWVQNFNNDIQMTLFQAAN